MSKKFVTFRIAIPESVRTLNIPNTVVTVYDHFDHNKPLGHCEIQVDDEFNVNARMWESIVLPFPKDSFGVGIAGAAHVKGDLISYFDLQSVSIVPKPYLPPTVKPEAVTLYSAKDLKITPIDVEAIRLSPNLYELNLERQRDEMIRANGISSDLMGRIQGTEPNQSNTPKSNETPD